MTDKKDKKSFPGELKKVPLREIWPNEARDFTPWLARHINVLGEALGMDLEVVEREKPIGKYSLDLHAVHIGTSKEVVIENQLEQTDHTHLGQLITYAGGVKASTVIWVCRSVRDEHWTALEYLNQRTDNKTQFFAVEVEGLRIDDSNPAPYFKPIVLPEEWQKKGKPSGHASLKSEKYRTYFQRLIDELRDVHKFTNARARFAQPQNWWAFPSGITGIPYVVTFPKGDKTRVEVYIENNKPLFDALDSRQKEITNRYRRESKFPESMFVWERLSKKQASRIAIYRDGVIDASEKDLEEIRKWHIDTLLEFSRVLTPIIKEVMESPG